MTRIEWNDEYLLGILEIDNQHKKLLSLANELYDIASGDGEKYKLQMSIVLKKLTDYTVYHFSSEEAFMQKHGYSGTSAHKMAHDGFISEVNTHFVFIPNSEQASSNPFRIPPIPANKSINFMDFVNCIYPP